MNKQMITIVFSVVISLPYLTSGSSAYDRLFEGMPLSKLERIIFDPRNSTELARIEALKEVQRILGSEQLDRWIRNKDHRMSIVYYNSQDYVYENTMKLYQTLRCQNAFIE